ncbi:MAG: hypothetical protein ACRC10_11070 [Thermoguttaceae bacterium]
MKTSAQKINLNSGSLPECLALMRRYQESCQNVRLVIVDFDHVGATFEAQINRKRLQLLERLGNISGHFETLNTESLGRYRYPVHQIKAFLYDALKGTKKTERYYEQWQLDKGFLQGALSEREELAQNWDRIQSGQEPNIPPEKLEASRQRIPRENVNNFLQYCEERSIFVVFNLPPKWHGTERAYCDEYEAYFSELNSLPHCLVIRSPNFDIINDSVRDEECFIDHFHMTEYGAKVYTNWLVDQMLQSPKVAAHLEQKKGQQVEQVSKTKEQVGSMSLPTRQ